MAARQGGSFQEAPTKSIGRRARSEDGLNISRLKPLLRWWLGVVVIAAEAAPAVVAWCRRYRG
jgi:hypothetical protein